MFTFASLQQCKWNMCPSFRASAEHFNNVDSDLLLTVLKFHDNTQ